MLKWHASAFFFALVALGGCGTPGGAGKVSAPEPELEVVRPVVVAERGDEEVLKAIGLIQDNNFRQAEANFEEIIKVRPEIAEAHFNLAWVRVQLGKHVDVVDAVRGGLAYRPHEINAYLLLGLSERESGLFLEAEKSYLAGLALAPDDSRLHMNLGILYDLFLLDTSRALTHYRRYQELQPAPDLKVAGWIAVLERREKK